MFKKTALIFAAMALSVGMASAASIGNCADGVGNVLSLTGGSTCSLGELEFGDFSVISPLSPGIIAINEAPGTSDDGSTAWLNFEFIPQGPGPANYTFSYSVTANEGFELIGLDASFGFYGGHIQLSEVGCAVAFAQGCSSNLGNLFIDTDDSSAPPSSAAFWFEAQSKVWVGKDLTVVDETSGVSDIFNSHHYRSDGNVPEVPEPATMLLFSSALLGLGYMRRKKS